MILTHSLILTHYLKGTVWPIRSMLHVPHWVPGWYERTNHLCEIQMTDWMKATHMNIYISGHGPKAWKVSGLAAWIWIEKTIIHMFVNSKNPYPFKKIKACYKLISNISFFHYWREYYSIIQWREKQLKQSKAQNNWSKYLLNQQIEVKWHSLQETGHYDEPCWIEVKRLIQILTHIQPYRYTH